MSNRHQSIPTVKLRADYEANNAIIREAFVTLLKQNKGLRPSIDELTEVTGLHASTIKKHLKALDVRDLMQENACFKLLTDDVILSIYRAAVIGKCLG